LGWVPNRAASPSPRRGGIKIQSFEKHGNECNPLEKLAAQVKTAIATGGGSKERE